MSQRLFRPLPTGSSPLNSTLINLAAQSLAFFHLVWSCRLDSRSLTDKSLCWSRCKLASVHAPKQALSRCLVHIWPQTDQLRSQRQAVGGCIAAALWQG